MLTGVEPEDKHGLVPAGFLVLLFARLRAEVKFLILIFCFTFSAEDGLPEIQFDDFRFEEDEFILDKFVEENLHPGVMSICFGSL